MASPMQDFPEFHLGDRLRKAREVPRTGPAHDRQAFASIIGCSRSRITKYESGEVTPRRYIVVAWALATGYSVEELDPKPGGAGNVNAAATEGDSPTRWSARAA